MDIQEKKTDRIAYLDGLRVFATLAVVLLHVCARGWDTADVMGSQWGALNLYNGAVRWCVLVFMMISGALFLSRDMEPKTICRKYVKKMVIVDVFWALVYVVAILAAVRLTTGSFSIPWTTLAYEGIKGAYHMWYLPMLIGFYLCMPVLRAIVKDLKTAKYFWLLSVVFQGVLPLVYNLLRDFAPQSIHTVVDAANILTNNMFMQTVMGFAATFVAGYVLSVTELSPKHRKLCYCLGIAGVVLAVGLNALASRKLQYPLETYLSCNNVYVAATAVAIFVWFQYAFRTEGKLYALVKKLSPYCFGVYLVHPFLMIIMEILGLDTLRFHPLLSVPVIWALVTVCSFAISFVLNKLPVLNKYIV